MAANSFYNSELDPPHPARGGNAYPLGIMNSGYTNVPSKTDEDIENSQVNVSSQEPLRSTDKPSHFNRLTQRKLEKLKRYTRVLQQVSKILTTLFSVIMFGFMMYMSIKFQLTKGTFRGDRTAWPKQPKLWPTIMLLIASGLNLISTLIMLFAYCCCYAKTQTSWKLTVVRYAIQVIAWVIVSFLYRYEKGLHGDNNDLWGWSCAEEATALQTQFNGVVDFKFMCKTQVQGFPRQ